MRRIFPFILLLPFMAKAGSDAPVTMVLLRAAGADSENPPATFSQAMLFIVAGEKTSLSHPQAVNEVSAGYPHFSSPLNIPLRITSAFSMRWHPLLRRFSQHEGTDFAAPPFTPVFATEKGIVVEAKYHPVAGNYVVVRHPQGWKSRYLHLNRLNVVPGQEIKQGSIVAYSGNTGRSTGPHLHFELMHQGQPVDAVKFLSASNASYGQMTAKMTSKISVPKIMLVTEIAGQEKVMVKYREKIIYASADQEVFGDYKVVLKSGRYRLQKVS
ncbi:M23 family metallopeptidase [Rahnella sp. CJA17(1/100)]|uniref:M23 family metallopeptidase n=1 Tax=Rahnella sp. CJA17(1/100) TaxID=2508951 RepID=UPI00106FE639|nr:M23 family metallopeptidase [Rahnella sp. CJA17(1/100)]